MFFSYLLLDYFSQHLGEYLNVLSALESLNVAILKAMDKTKEVRESMTTFICASEILLWTIVVCKFASIPSSLLQKLREEPQ